MTASDALENLSLGALVAVGLAAALLLWLLQAAVHLVAELWRLLVDK